MRPAFGFVQATAALIAASAHGAVPVVRVGAITSQKNCTLYQMTAGSHREAAVVTRSAAGYASQTSWVDYLVRDCVDHFSSLKMSIQAALASTGKISVASGPAGGNYIVDGRISEVSGGGPADPARLGPGGSFAISSSSMFVNMDVTVRDPAGRIVYGGLLTKHLESGFSMATAGMRTSASESGEATYGELQHQIALAVARVVAFRIEPLRVTAVEGKSVQLNYGAPLLQLGTVVQVTAADGSIMKYNVTGAGQGSAQASYYGGADSSHVQPGSTAIVLEADDAAANGRRFEKVDLP